MASWRGVLLDIEGTTSSVSFVYDQMFPYARRKTAAYLAEHWLEPPLIAAIEQMACDAGFQSTTAWESTNPGTDLKHLVELEAIRLMDADIKATGLKLLQGLVWEDGFRSRELIAHVYPDVVPALRAWDADGVDLRVYSSGSVHAQKLFFAHTEAGDLTPLFTGHYDTTIGAKRSAESYLQIAQDWRLPPESILFLSDVTAELDAARAAGMQTYLVVRPGNAPAPALHDYPTICSFAELPAAS